MKTIIIVITLLGLWGQSLAQDLTRNLFPEIAMITWRGETRAEVGFMDGLKGYGYHPRFIACPCGQDLGRLDQIMDTLEKKLPDLIYVFGTTATKTVVSRIKTCPVIFNIVTRPVESGIIANWDSSGNNATGISSLVPLHHQILALEKVAPFSRLGVIYNPLEQNSVIQTRILGLLARSQGFELVEYKISAEDEVNPVLARLGEGVDAVYLPSDSMVKSLGKQIMAQVNARHLPSLAALEEMVIHDGALIGLVPDYYQLGRMAAQKAGMVLAGQHPSSIPSATSDHFNITVNLNTAKQIQIQIPTSVLVMADKIIR